MKKLAFIVYFLLIAFTQNKAMDCKLHEQDSLKKVLQSLNRGGDINKWFKKAVIRGQLTTAEMLIMRGADVDLPSTHKKQTALHIATDKENPDCMQLLLQHKANPNAQNCEGFTPTLLAVAARNRTDLLALLLKHQADVNIPTNDGETPLIIATLMDTPALPSLIDKVALLLQHKADVNAADGIGLTALIHAANNSNLAVVKLLLAHQADVTLQTHTGKTAWDWTTCSSIKKLVAPDGKTAPSKKGS